MRTTLGMSHTFQNGSRAPRNLHRSHRHACLPGLPLDQVVSEGPNQALRLLAVPNRTGHVCILVLLRMCMLHSADSTPPKDMALIGTRQNFFSGPFAARGSDVWEWAIHSGHGLLSGIGMAYSRRIRLVGIL